MKNGDDASPERRATTIQRKSWISVGIAPLFLAGVVALRGVAHAEGPRVQVKTRPADGSFQVPAALQ